MLAARGRRTVGFAHARRIRPADRVDAAPLHSTLPMKLEQVALVTDVEHARAAVRALLRIPIVHVKRRYRHGYRRLSVLALLWGWWKLVLWGWWRLLRRCTSTRHRMALARFRLELLRRRFLLLRTGSRVPL